MSAVTRVAVAGLLAPLLMAAATSPHARTEANEAVPSALLRDWSWRHVGPFGPVAEFISVTTDNAFPYRVCGTATDGRAACASSRDDGGWISARNWEWLRFDAATPIALDPLDGDIAYGGALRRFDRRTAQMQDVTPAAGDDERIASAGLLLFAPTDARTLYFATTVIRKTSNGGLNWTAIGPTLSRAVAVDVTPTRDGAASPPISAFAASSVDGRVLWAGTADGRLHVTRDAGVTWSDATPASITATSSIARVEASRFDPSTAYVVVGTASDADAPRAMRTRDAGGTWTDIGRAIPDGAAVNVIREDPFRRGLLFAGTSRSVVMSTDDGDTWQTLALNLPAIGVTDLAIKDADLIAATSGRAFWVLDDISPLRQLTQDVARTDAFLFRPAVAWRERSREKPADVPAESPPARTPPPGATFNYLIGPAATGPVSIDVVETVSGDVIRRFSSEGPTPTMSSVPGLHRVTWDLRYTPIRGRGVLVQAGTYQVRLTAHGRVVRQAVVVRMDPRVRTSTADLEAQSALSKRVYAKLRDLATARDEAGLLADSAAAFDAVTGTLINVLDSLQQSDTRPTPALTALAIATIDRASALLAAPQP